MAKHATILESAAPIGSARKRTGRTIVPGTPKRGRPDDSNKAPAEATRNQPVQPTVRRSLPSTGDDDPQRAEHIDAFWEYLQLKSQQNKQRRDEEYE